MKRTGFKRRPHHKRLQRRTPMRRENPERKAKLRAVQFGALAQHVRGMPCCSCGHTAPSDAHHVRSRGAGHGAWVDCPSCHAEGTDAATGQLCNDCEGQRTVGNLTPLCRSCHDEFHKAGALTWIASGRPNLVGVAISIGRGFRLAQIADDYAIDF